MRAIFSRFDVRVSVAYLLVAILWIITSDTLLVTLFSVNPALLQIANLLKGFGFVGVTSVALFAVVHNELRKHDRLENQLRAEALEHTHAEAALQKITRLYRVLSDGNQILIRATDEQQLLQSICTLLVEGGGYRLAWVGYAEADERKSIRVMASMGYEEGYLESIKLSWDESVTAGQGPTGIALRTGQVTTIRYILSDPRYAPWRAEALRRGYASSTGLPISMDGQVIGVLNLYAVSEDAFDSEETALLTELANDLGYGIWARRTASQEERARHMLEQERDISPVGIAIMKPTGEFRYVNAQAEHVLGLTRSPSANQPFNTANWCITDYEGNPISDEYLPSALVRRSGQAVYGIQQAIETPDGRRVLLEINAAPVFDSGGAVSEVVTTFNDVTLLQTQSRLLRESEIRYRLLVEHSPYAIGVYQDGLLVFVNQAAALLLGAESPDELIGKPISAIIYAENLQSAQQRISRMLQGETGLYPTEDRYVRLDSSSVEVEVTAAPFIFRDKPAVQMIALDSTKRKYAEDRYRRVLDSLLEGAEIIGFGWRYLYVNDTIASHGRQPKDVLMGSTVIELYPGIENTEMFAGLRRVMEERTARHFETEFVFPDGYTAWFELSVQPVPEGIFILSLDITERKRAEQGLRQYSQRLQTLSAQLVSAQEMERRHIARELHDEVGQTLTALSLMLDMQARQSASGDTPPDLREAQSLVSELMKRVRELSLDLRPSMLDDLGLIPTLIWFFKRYQQQTQITVDFKYSDAEHRYSSVIETTLYRIIQEALTNVARHARVDRVSVRVWGTPDSIHAQVEDAGIGFDLEAVQTANMTSGIIGLGERAQLVGGTCEIESSLGAGTSITLYIPL